ncbi:MAG: VPLPA-CTERM-specific exosortase XrtD [Deltaproteobacteria bacterium]|nr:VPLPA-CTERM-specific exosortase XrtD [Deltaproteobacteria bacterium]
MTPPISIDRGKLPLTVWAPALFLAVLFAGLFWPTLSHMAARWPEDDFSYCYLIPPLIVYLVWEQRQPLARIRPQPSLTGLIPFSLGLLLFWLGELGGEFFTLYLSAWLVLVGLCWTLLGRTFIRLLWFPLAMIPAMFPVPNVIAANLSLRLKLISSDLGVRLMHLAGMSAYREGNIIDIGFTQLQVVDACGGLRYFFPIVLLAMLLGYLYRLNWWRWGAVIASAPPIVVLANGLRIAGTGYLFPFFGPRVAEGFFHDFAGWFSFMAALAMLVPEILLLRMIPSRIPPIAAKPTEEPEQIPVVSASAKGLFLVVAMILGVNLGLASGVDFRERVPAKQPLAGFPVKLAGWQGENGTLDRKILDELDLSDYLMRDYRDGSGRPVNVYVAYYESQRKGESIHSPSSCLPGGGWRFQESGARIIAGEGLPEGFRVQRALISKGGQTQLSFYWFMMRGRVLTDLYQVKAANFWDALTKQRSDGALVRLITPVFPGEKVADAEARLLNLTFLLMPVLEEFIPGKEM